MNEHKRLIDMVWVALHPTISLNYAESDFCMDQWIETEDPVTGRPLDPDAFVTMLVREALQARWDKTHSQSMGV